MFGSKQRHQRNTRGHLGTVEQRQPFLGGQSDGSDPGVLQRLAGRHDLPVDAYLAFAHGRQGQMRQGGQITGCTDRTLGGDTGPDPGVVDRDQGGQRLLAHTRVAPRQGSDLGGEDQAHAGIVEQWPHAHGVRTYQVGLQLFQLLAWDVDFGQFAEAGVDAIGRLAGGHDGLHGLRRGADVVPAICVQGDGISPLRDLPQLGQRQLARCQGEHAIHSKMAGRVRPCSRAQASACS